MPTESSTRIKARVITVSAHRRQWMLRLPRHGPGRIAAHHGGTELRIFVNHLRRAGVMRRDPAMLRREAERDSDSEIRQRIHLPVEPGQGIRAATVGPG